MQIADMKMGKKHGTLITYALGSCVGISIYDPQLKLAALIHIMLPNAVNPKESMVFKFADIGIKETLRRMDILGGVRQRYICKIAGGAKMFDVYSASNLSNIGDRNIESVETILRNEGIRIANRDVRGNYARTMLVDIETGLVSIRTIGKAEKNI